MIEGLNSKIEELEYADRRIFNVSDLLENKTEVSFYDIRSFKTKNKGK